MNPTDTSDPNYFHRVVDCQWACPAHTNVPEYIRLIAQGRYTDAYMSNRESNVFPGILGRTCDRPCEPACRRTRIDGAPVAICRLKRVASDLRGDIEDRLPVIPTSKNGRRVVCVGAGPASLTVANDLMPLGYDVVILEQHETAGGLMRTNIPAFRLPAEVLDEEIATIVDMGVDLRLNTPVSSLRSLLAQDFDAVFIGTGAPRGKDLDIPGRHDSDRIHIGIDWLESVAFGHTEKIGARVLIIGVGNTAMDCCRSSLRLGGTDIKVMARRPRTFFKASAWELEDAEEEGVEILVNHAPTRFVIEDGRLVGMEFQRLQWDEQARHSTVIDSVVIACDDVILAIGQENAFPWIERDLGLEVGDWDMPVVDPVTFQSSLPGVFFGGDSAMGPKNIIWAVEHGHQAAISIHNHCEGIAVTSRPPQGVNLVSQKMGLTEWSYNNDYNPSSPAEDAARRTDAPVQEHRHRGGGGVFRRADRARGAALPELRYSDRLRCAALHRVRCMHRHLPGAMPDHHRERRRGRPAHAVVGSREEPRPGAVCFRSTAPDGARDGEGRGPLRALRPVRRALPNRRVGHAEIRAPASPCAPHPDSGGDLTWRRSISSRPAAR